MRANWKVVMQAFMEAYHVIVTHPQIVTGHTQDGNTKYDVFGNYSRAITVAGMEEFGLPNWGPVPPLPSQRDVRSGIVYTPRADGNVDAVAPDGRRGVFAPNADWVSGELGEANPHMCNLVGGRQLPAAAMDVRGRSRVMASTKIEPLDVVGQHRAMASIQREAYRSVIGDLADKAADIEFAPVYFTLFPNFHPWGSFNRIVYRFRPNGNNPDESIMECMYMAPIPADGKYPKGLPIHWLGADDDWVDAPELGMLAKVFNQDSRNLPFVQEGLHATAKANLQLASYNETKLRHFHKLLDEWIQKP